MNPFCPEFVQELLKGYGVQCIEIKDGKVVRKTSVIVVLLLSKEEKLVLL